MHSWEERVEGNKITEVQRSEHTFEQKSCHIEVGDSINQKFIEISTRQASFNSMKNLPRSQT